MMEFTAEMIAGFLGGQVAGDKEAKVHTVSSIEEGEPGALTYLTNPKYEKHLYKTRASIVLVIQRQHTDHITPEFYRCSK